MLAPPGRILRLIALDRASADIPAWCRLTGHALLDHHHPVYLIRRKES
jgi:TusA-related sulfurtransferase